MNPLNNLTPDEIYDYLSNKRQIENYETISPSSLKTFLDCRLKYFFQYIKGWRINVKSPVFSLGSGFHAAAELNNRKEALGGRASKLDLFGEFDSFWNKEVEDFKDVHQYKLDCDRRVGLDVVEKYHKSKVRRSIKPELTTSPYADDSSLVEPAVELFIDVPLYNSRTMETYRDDFRVTGFIDLVATGRSKTKDFDKDDLLVIDYKTASRLWSLFDVKANVQILMYAYAIRYLLNNTKCFEHLSKKKEDYVGIICLKKGSVLKSGVLKPGKVVNFFIKVEDAEIDFLEKMLLKCAEEVQKNRGDINQWMPSPSKENCQYCNFQTPCLAYRGGAKEDELNLWWKDVVKKGGNK